MATGARVHIYGDWDGTGVKNAQKDIGLFEKQASGFAGSFTKSFAGIGAAIGGAFAIGTIGTALLDFMKSSIQGAIEDEKSMVSLAKAMDNVGLSSQKVIAEEALRKMSLLYGIADDDLRPALQSLVTGTGDLTEAQKLLGLAMDISAATGKDLQSVSLALVKAHNGNLGALTRLGVPLDAAIVKSKDFAAATDALTKKFGGQARAASETYGGQLAKISNAASEASETVGYALMGAIEDLSGAFGGTGGVVGAIDAAGTSLANFITGLSVATTAFANFVKATQGDGLSQTVANWEFIANLAGPLGPALAGVAAGYQKIADEGAKAAAEEAKISESLRASEALYAGYTATLDANAEAAKRTTAAQAETTIKLGDAERAAIKVHDSVVYATDALKAFQAAISQSGSMDKWKSDLLEIAAKYKGVSTALDDSSAAGLQNRNDIRGYAADLVTAAQDWGTRYHATATQVVEKQATMVATLRKNLKNAGFSQADIDKFLGGLGLWNTQIKLMAQGVSRGEGASAMRYEGMALGKDMYLGIIAGLNAGNDPVWTAAETLAHAAIAGARYAAQAESPSRRMIQLGTDMVDGLVIGLADKDDKVAQAARDMLQALLDKAQQMVDGWDQKLADLKGKLDEAQNAVKDWAKSTSDSLVSAFDLTGVFGGAIDENGKFVASKFTTGFDAAMKQFQWYTNVLTSIKASGGSDALLQFLMSQGVEKGGAYGQGLIDNGLIPYVDGKLSSIQEMATTTADSMIPSFLTAGVSQAQAMYDGFAKNYGKDGPVRVAMENLMDRIANSLGRTVTVTVKTVYEAAGLDGKRAMGGVVGANKAYLVGEKGPEILVTGNSGGLVIPNGGLPTGSGSFGRGGGNSYSITVQAGVGDPRQIGQQIVEYVKRFEAASGPVFAPAA